MRHLASLNADIVSLQEVFGSFVFDPLVRAARALGWHVSTKTIRALGGLGQTSGLLTLSKFPIEHQEFIRFDAECGEDTWAAKGLLYTTIRLPDKTLLGVVNTHLQADAVFASTARCVRARRAAPPTNHGFLSQPRARQSPSPGLPESAGTALPDRAGEKKLES